MSRLELSLLGSPEVRLDGEPVSGFRSGKTQALLYYLAVTGQRHMRPALAGLLWGEWPEKDARVNLNQTLSNLRQLLGEHLNIDRHTVALDRSSQYWLDVEALQANDITLPQVLRLLRGELLEGFYVHEAAEFEAWLRHERVRLRERTLVLLQHLAQHHSAQGEGMAAIEATRRMVEMEPWREEAHRQLMTLLAQNGQRSAALAQYESCCQALADEFGVEPAAETIALYDAILHSSDELTLRVEDNERQAGGADQLVTVSPAQRVTPHLPPVQTTPFVGREDDLAEMLRQLCNPACRLLTLVGPGGIGKTRLATEAVRRLVTDEAAARIFADGIFFVPLDTVTTADAVVAAIAETVGFRFYSHAPPRQQLLDYLTEKRMLLVLDNFEHVLSTVDFIATLLTTAADVKLLVTSQVALNLQEEWFYTVAGLAVPDTEDEITIERYDAVCLFVQSAQRARPGFSLAQDAAPVARICRLVDGTPLALELAATWLKTLPAVRVAEEIERNLDILSSRQHNMPNRHRSMRAVLDQTWQRLSDEEQTVLLRLSVFLGGFSETAAATIASASLLTQVTLVEKSLLRVDVSGRYQMHELLRQFASEKLAAQPEAFSAVHQQHSAFYLDLLRQHAPHLRGKGQQSALTHIGREIDNICKAWLWAVAQGDVEQIAPRLDGLYDFFQIRSRYQEGKALFARVLTQVSEETDLSVRVLSRLGAFHQSLGDYETAADYLQRGLAAAQRVGDRQEEALALNLLGQVAAWRGQKEQARDYFSHSLIISRATHDKFGVVSALQQSANLLYATFGDYTASKKLAEESLSLSREIGRADWLAYALDTLGFVTFALGEYQAALGYYQEGLAHFEEIGDPHGMALTWGGIGMVHWALGNAHLDAARAAFERSLALCRRIGHRGQVSGRLGGLARVLNDWGDYEQARQFGEEGLSIARALNSPVYLAHNLYCLTETACGMNDLVSARRYLREGLQIALEAGLRSNLTIYLYYYALVLSKESQRPGLAPALQQQKEQSALAALALVQDHPATWQIFKERAAWLQRWITGERPVDLPTAQDADDQLDERVVALLHELGSSAA